MKIEVELKQTESELPIINNMYGKFFYNCYVCNATTRDTGFVFVDKYDRKFNICAKCCADKIKKVDTLELRKYKDKFSEYTYYLKDGEEVLHGLCKGYYGNGKIRIEYNYKNGKFHGLCKEYDENGQLEYENNWENGKFHGLCKGYYEDGKIRIEYNYKDGKFHGLCKDYDESGKLESENNWKDGEFEEREHKKGGNKNESKKV